MRDQRAKSREIREQLKSCETREVPYACKYASVYIILNFFLYLFVYFFYDYYWIHVYARKNSTCIWTLTPTIKQSITHWKVRWPLRFICSYALLVTQHYKRTRNFFTRDHGGLGFSAQQYHQKPASDFLCNSLAALVRHSQAQKCLQIKPKPFQQVMKF